MTLSSFEERFDKEFPLGGEVWVLARHRKWVLAFIKSEIDNQRVEIEGEWVKRIENGMELWFSTHDRMKRNFDSNDLIKFIKEGI